MRNKRKVNQALFAILRSTIYLANDFAVIRIFENIVQGEK